MQQEITLQVVRQQQQRHLSQAHYLHNAIFDVLVHKHETVHYDSRGNARDTERHDDGVRGTE